MPLFGGRERQIIDVVIIVNKVVDDLLYKKKRNKIM